MIVSIDEQGMVRLDDAANCRAFSFRKGGSEAGAGAVDFADGYAWVSEAAIRAWPPLTGDDRWQAEVTAMIAFAATKGWVSPDGSRVRAHIETD